MADSKKKGYDFTEVEPRIKEFWEEEDIFTYDNSKNVDYSIDTPPPTVSGAMHIGHSFSYAQQDFIARYRRMKSGVFYPFGTDDNGLPTEKLVEKINKVKSKKMSRQDFINLCIKTLKEITPDFVEDWKRLGISADFKNTYSTIDDNSRKISQKAFIELYNKGEIYEKEFPTLWCPNCQTAVAQAELEDKEKKTYFTTIKFSTKKSNLQIATTRPEMLEACVAVFVNPNDERYKDFVGKKAKVPLSSHEVPILEDESADPEKGTGVLMICSYGDKFDVDAINRHGLTPKIIFDEKGIINQGENKDLKIEDARKKILEDLKENNLIENQDEIIHAVNTHDKCGTPIEFIPTNQWFIKIIDKKEQLIKQGKKINWNPSHMFKRYENWVNGLEWDWSISRDRHFGVSIPLWKCNDCSEVILPSEEDLPIDPIETKGNCPKCGKEAIPETKVLDTWATSSLTPRISSLLIENKITTPYSLRPQAHDIIRTWAFYTITRSYMHDNNLPWNDIMISGNVSLKGEKMSKSKGNVISPREVIEKYGADPLRFWAAGSKLGEDLDYQEQDLVAGKKTVTKLINATKFAFMNLEDYNFEKPEKLEKIDEEFLNHLEGLIKTSTEAFESYRYSVSKLSTEQFFWGDFADNYIEIVKKRIYKEAGQKRVSAQYVLYTSLLTITKLFAPIMPFVTEEIYQEYFKKQEKDNSIHISSWPEYNQDAKESETFNFFCELLRKVRSAKTNSQKSMNSEIILSLTKEDLEKLGETKDDFASVTASKEIKEGEFSVEFI